MEDIGFAKGKLEILKKEKLQGITTITKRQS